MNKVLDAIQARADAASTGPWAIDNDDFDGASVYMDDGITWGRAYVCTDLQQGDDGGQYDAEFIAHAREDVPKLVAALRAVESLATEWHKDYSEIDSRWDTDDNRYIRRDGRDDAAHEITEAISSVLNG